MKALRIALQTARMEAPILPRDEYSPSRRGAPGFEYPSQESIQEAARLLDKHGLLLMPDGAEIGERTATLAWTLIHVESEESQGYVLDWPLFSDMTERAHQLAAAWAHAWRHLIMQLLALRVAPRGVVVGERGDDLPEWGGGKGTPSKAPFVPPWHPTPATAAQDPARPTFSPDALIELIQEWCAEEEAHDRAEGRKPRPRTLDDAWAACCGGTAARLVQSRADHERLFTYLHDERRRRRS
jgi:hypothetical protein